jgi:hypothetical protein
MRFEAGLLLALSTGACSIYEQTVGNGAAGGSGAPTSGETTGRAGAGGEGGTDIGTSGGGAGASGATTSSDVGAGGAAAGVGGAGGAGSLGGAGAAGTSAGGTAGATAGVGGTGGKAGEGGSAGTNGSGGGGAGAGGTTSKTDAGADAAPDASSAVCAPGTCKRVFVSLASPAPRGNLGGIAAVDTFCQTSADAKSLGGTWKAWISDTTGSPSTRFTKATVPYRLLDGSTIAANYTALTSGTLAHAINVHEDGMPVPSGTTYEVWTGTKIDGTYSTRACANWTNDTASAPTADIGVTSVTNNGWTNIYQQFCDRTMLRVYCFEQ